MSKKMSIDKYYGVEELVCPYCGKKQLSHEPEEISANICITECEHCGKEIEYDVEVIRLYYPIIDEDEEESEEE